MFPSEPTQIHDDEALEQLKTKAQVAGFIEADVRNTVIVDSAIKLEFAMEVVSKTSLIGVDFEGSLKKGILWLA